MKLFVSDLDKTLMNEHHEISQKNIDALQALIDNGVEIAIATGRSYDNMVEICRKYPIQPHIIASNGAQVYDKQGCLIYENPLKYEDIKDILMFCDQHNIIYQLFTEKNRYTKLIDNLIYELIALGKNRYDVDEYIMKRAQSFFDLLYHNPLVDDDVLYKLKSDELSLYKIEISCSNISYLNEIKRLYEGCVKISSSTIDNLEITASGIHKAIGLRELCEYLHIDLVDVCAVGDNYNDIELLQAAGFSIAMGNAVDDVLAICDVISDTNEQDGVGNMIMKILNEECKIS